MHKSHDNFIQTNIFLLGLLFVGLFLSVQRVNAQDSEMNRNIYSVIYNRVGDNYPYPLLGLINRSGSHYFGMHLGVYNKADGVFSGLQIGGFNTIIRSDGAAQFGYLNYSLEGSPLQFGVINSAKVKKNGFAFQFGAWNDLYSDYALLRYDSDTLFSVGWVTDYLAIQVGAINDIPSLNGIQFGLLNFTDTICNGLQIGFLSFVRKGGYMTVEGFAATNGFSGFAFKTGLRKFYTHVLLGYHPNSRDALVNGWGMGTILPLYSNSLGLNIEYAYIQDIFSPRIFLSNMLSFNVRWTIQQKYNLSIGPLLSRERYETHQEFQETTNNLNVGLRLGLSYDFR